MIIIESDNNFFIKNDIIHYQANYNDITIGMQYNINFIIIQKLNNDINFRKISVLNELDKVYIKNKNNVKILSNLSHFHLEANDIIPISEVRSILANKIKNHYHLNELVNDNDINKIISNIHCKNYKIFYSIIADDGKNKQIMKL